MIPKPRHILSQTRLTSARLCSLRRSAEYGVNSCRSYAFSRFQDRGPGSHRARERPARVNPRKRVEDNPDIADDGVWQDVKIGPFTFRVSKNNRTWTSSGQPDVQQPYSTSDTFSEPRASRPEQEQSPLWEAASQRAPASDPREGLERLLMGNDLLVITRYVLCVPVQKHN